MLSGPLVNNRRSECIGVTKLDSSREAIDFAHKGVHIPFLRIRLLLVDKLVMRLFRQQGQGLPRQCQGVALLHSLVQDHHRWRNWPESNRIVSAQPTESRPRYCSVDHLLRRVELLYKQIELCSLSRCHCCLLLL